MVRERAKKGRITEIELQTSKYISAEENEGSYLLAICMKWNEIVSKNALDVFVSETEKATKYTER